MGRDHQDDTEQGVFSAANPVPQDLAGLQVLT
jgi:hypothetical protein